LNVEISDWKRKLAVAESHQIEVEKQKNDLEKRFQTAEEESVAMKKGHEEEVVKERLALRAALLLAEESKEKLIGIETRHSLEAQKEEAARVELVKRTEELTARTLAQDAQLADLKKRSSELEIEMETKNKVARELSDAVSAARRESLDAISFERNAKEQALQAVAKMESNFDVVSNALAVKSRDVEQALKELEVANARHIQREAEKDSLLRRLNEERTELQNELGRRRTSADVNEASKSESVVLASRISELNDAIERGRLDGQKLVNDSAENVRRLEESLRETEQTRERLVALQKMSDDLQARISLAHSSAFAEKEEKEKLFQQVRAREVVLLQLEEELKMTRRQSLDEISSERKEKEKYRAKFEQKVHESELERQQLQNELLKLKETESRKITVQHNVDERETKQLANTKSSTTATTQKSSVVPWLVLAAVTVGGGLFAFAHLKKHE
jgi:hypothetical protein